MLSCRKGFCYALFFFLSLSFCQTIYAAETIFISSKEIKNVKTQLSRLKKRSILPVVFPRQIPAPQYGQIFYVSCSSDADRPDYAEYWQINVDIMPDCHGTRICNVGFVAAKKSAPISPYYETMPGPQKRRKEKISLPCHFSAYYTPFHIAAGAINPTLEWRQNNIQYTLTWKIEGTAAQQKQILLRIAASALCTR